jgi:hypothetical protein
MTEKNVYTEFAVGYEHFKKKELVKAQDCCTYAYENAPLAEYIFMILMLDTANDSYSGGVSFPGTSIAGYVTLAVKDTFFDGVCKMGEFYDRHKSWKRALAIYESIKQQADTFNYKKDKLKLVEKKIKRCKRKIRGRNNDDMKKKKSDKKSDEDNSDKKSDEDNSDDNK